MHILDRFNYELEQQINGNLPKGHIYNLGKPGEILRNAGIPDLPIELSADRLAYKASENYRRNHPFNLSDIKNLPEAINNPIAVFNSTKNDGAKIILTELKDKNGNNFVVVMRVKHKGKGRDNIEINDIRSIYPKNNRADLINILKSGKLTAWIDKEKASRFVSVQSTNLIGNGNKAETY
ncbi:MAG: hypothetical protein LBB36_01455 [Fibromonadaceae bacterium]|jgi:hypothetical protein|nr:hypothetical protein [Fibromonadaceae bacterium]